MIGGSMSRQSLRVNGNIIESLPFPGKHLYCVEYVSLLGDVVPCPESVVQWLGYLHRFSIDDSPTARSDGSKPWFHHSIHGSAATDRFAVLYYHYVYVIVLYSTIYLFSTSSSLPPASNKYHFSPQTNRARNPSSVDPVRTTGPNLSLRSSYLS